MGVGLRRPGPSGGWVVKRGERRVSGGAALVVMVETADFRDLDDPACARWLRRARDRRRLAPPSPHAREQDPDETTHAPQAQTHGRPLAQDRQRVAEREDLRGNSEAKGLCRVANLERMSRLPLAWTDAHFVAARTGGAYSAELKTTRNVPNDWSRHCGLNPNRMTCPWSSSTSSAAAFP